MSNYALGCGEGECSCERQRSLIVCKNRDKIFYINKMIKIMLISGSQFLHYLRMEEGEEGEKVLQYRRKKWEQGVIEKNKRTYCRGAL